MKLGIDVDGVAADFTGAVDDWVKLRHGLDPVPHSSWTWYEQYPDGKNIFRDLMNRGYHDDHLFLGCKPIKGAVKSIKHLAYSGGHDIEFITHRPETVSDDTRRWLDSFELCWPVHHIEAKEARDCDIYLDDSVDVVRRLREAGNRAVLFAQPWNEELQHEGTVVHTWFEFEMYVTGVMLMTEAKAVPSLSVLEEAQGLIHGDRNEAYGHPLDDFGCTSEFWASWVRHKYGIKVPFEAEDVGMMMSLLKHSREANNHKRDNLVDVGGYIGTVEMCIEEKARRESEFFAQSAIEDSSTTA